MHFVSRQFVCDRLGVSQWASYAMFPATKTGYISSDCVTALLNRSRKAREPELDYIPSDIVTANELADKTGIPAVKLIRWTRRSKKTIPHFRINKQTTRFRINSVLSWLNKE